MCDDDSKVRLRLKNSVSTINDFCEDAKKEYSGKDSNTAVLHEDDSLLDFKSPNSKSSKRTCFANFKYKPTARVASLKCKSGGKNERRRKKICPDMQPSIESSFFKSNSDVQPIHTTEECKTAFVCPLCFKTFKDTVSQTLHMKTCASKNNVSTNKLLDAIKLQERQALERKSLGLLSAPVLQDKREKKSAPRKMALLEDSELQLALALSESLQSAKEMEWREELGMQGSFMEDCQNSELLGNYPILNDKPSGSSKTKKIKRLEFTALQTRTEEERNRMLTEKIAEILMGDDKVTQRLQDRANGRQSRSDRIILISNHLRGLWEMENPLWERAKLMQIKGGFHVKSLSPQIPERKDNILKVIHEIVNMNNSMDEQLNKSGEREDFALSPDRKDEGIADERFVDILVNDWRNTLNSSFASDLIIFVSDNKFIFAHKLVFYVRCPEILLDVLPNADLTFGSIKEQICWREISYEASLAFLEFVYCGVIRKYMDFARSEGNLSRLRNLARRYRMKELFAFLRGAGGIDVAERINLDDAPKDSKKEEAPLRISSVRSAEKGSRERFSSQSSADKADLSKPGTPNFIEEKSKILEASVDLGKVRSACVMDGDEDRRYNGMSPDMFDDLEESICKRSGRSWTSWGNKESSREKQSGMENDADNFTLKEGVSPNRVVPRNVSQKSPEEKLEETPRRSMEYPIIVECSSARSAEVDSMESRHRLESASEEPTQSEDKRRNRLSLFIERFREENAKQDSDFTSDSDYSLEISSKLARNPFNLEENDKPETPSWRKFGRKSYSSSVLGGTTVPYSKFVRTKSATQPLSEYAWKNALDSEHDEISVLVAKSREGSRENVGWLEKRTKSERFSIESSLKSATILNPEKSGRGDDDVESPEKRASGQGKKRRSIGEAGRLSSADSVTDEDVEWCSKEDMSLYSRYKMTNRDNSIAKYRPPGNAKEPNAQHAHMLGEDFDLNYARSEDSETSTILLRRFSGNSFSRASAELSPRSLDRFPDGLRGAAASMSDGAPGNEEGAELACDFEGKRAERNELVSSSASPILVSSSPEMDGDNAREEMYIDVEEEEEGAGAEAASADGRSFEDDIFLANADLDEEMDRPTKNRTLSGIEPGVFFSSSKRSIPHSKGEDEARSGPERSRKRSASAAGLAGVSSGFRLTAKRPLKTRVSVQAVTPPPGYDAMSSPELHKELKKFGLRTQKRSRAVKLLGYVYNELHPLLPSEEVRSLIEKNAENEKVSVGKSSPDKNEENENDVDIDQGDQSEEQPSQSSQSEKSVRSLTAIIADKFKSEDSESLGISETPTNIGDAFLKLIKTNRNLYLKILKYEPLCIESLRATLKAEGFKCKIDVLMDFLDEQCIAFQVQENTAKNKRRKRKIK